MTKLVWCEQGHRYDKELSTDCPECRNGGMMRKLVEPPRQPDAAGESPDRPDDSDRHGACDDMGNGAGPPDGRHHGRQDG